MVNVLCSMWRRRHCSLLVVFTVIYVCVTALFLSSSYSSLSPPGSSLAQTGQGRDTGDVTKASFPEKLRKTKNLRGKLQGRKERFEANSSAEEGLDIMPRLLRQHHAGGLPVVITAKEFRRQPNSLTGNPLIDTYGENDWLLAGEMGRGVTFSGEEKPTSEKLENRWHINTMASDVIPVNRMLPDSRPEGCVHVTFPRELPSASIVIPFHDEWPSVLLRTVYSVINRTPRHLLHQVVLVDDNSTLAALGAPLDQYIRDFFPRDLIRLERLRERTGLIASRMEGLRHSHGDIVVFLDSHVEVNVAWLQPLLVEIQGNRQTLAMSTLDYINAHTFEYNYYRNRPVRYGFDWRLFFFELNFRSDHDVSSPHATRPGVVAVGTAFAINRKYFEDLGGYDVGMKIWGGENIELSWRVWLCGGRLLHVPCSRVGHVARTQPYSFGAKGRHMTTMLNYKRAAEVWMGPYRKFVYENFPEMEALDVGDLTERKAVKSRLHCQNFTWYLDNIWPQLTVYDRDVIAWGSALDVGDLTERKAVKSRLHCQNFTWYLDNIWPQLTVYDRDVIAWGSLYNNGTGHCLDNHAFMEGPPRIYAEGCHYHLNTQGFSLTVGGHLRTTLHCVVLRGTWLGSRPLLEYCESPDIWRHTEDGAIIHVQSQLCLDEDHNGPVISYCRPNVTSQKWLFTKYVKV